MTLRNRHGYTLIEMIVVLAVLGLAIGLVLLRGPAHSRTAEIRATAREVAQGLREARAQAIASNRTVTFERSGSTIRFAPDGSSSGGTINFVDGPLRSRIRVDWLTGRVTVEDVR